MCMNFVCSTIINYLIKLFIYLKKFFIGNINIIVNPLKVFIYNIYVAIVGREYQTAMQMKCKNQ